ncbi:MAG: hypothetical protein ABIF71_11490 [Planctomycetota bacterium]
MSTIGNAAAMISWYVFFNKLKDLGGRFEEYVPWAVIAVIVIILVILRVYYMKVKANLAMKKAAGSAMPPTTGGQP